MSLLDVKHQPAALKLIRRAMIRQRLPHAYIFHGPDGVGKERCARGLAESLFCPHAVEKSGDDGEALRVGCGTCVDCRLLHADTHPDWHIIHRQLNRDHPDPEVRRRKALEIGVDVLRHFVIDAAGLTPQRGRAKVFVIREADRITTQAQNALLKTLEEPPGETFIILLVSSLERLLPTTLSRCQLVGFGTLPSSFIQSELARRRPDLASEALDWYATWSSGSLGAALTAVDDDLHAVNARWLEALLGSSAIGNRGSTPRPPQAQKANPLERLTELAGVLADQYRKRDPDISPTESNRRALKTLFQLTATRYAEMVRRPDPHRWSIDQHELCNAIQRLAVAERQLDLNANTQLVAETLLNDLPSPTPATARTLR